MQIYKNFCKKVTFLGLFFSPRNINLRLWYDFYFRTSTEPFISDFLEESNTSILYVTFWNLV